MNTKTALRGAVGWPVEETADDAAGGAMAETVAGAAFLNPAQVELDGIAPEEQPVPAA